MNQQQSIHSAKFYNFLQNYASLNSNNIISSINGDYRFINFFNLRSTTKNFIITHNALQKVFRSRLDENRSNSSVSFFSTFHKPQPFLSSSRPFYEKLLGKNKKNYYNVLFYKNL